MIASKQFFSSPNVSANVLCLAKDIVACLAQKAENITCSINVPNDKVIATKRRCYKKPKLVSAFTKASADKS